MVDIMSLLCFLDCELTKKMNTNSILIVYLVNLTQQQPSNDNIRAAVGEVNNGSSEKAFFTLMKH